MSDVHQGVHHEVDPVVEEAVQMVRDRFGASGLRDMIERGRQELAEVEASLADLRESVARD